MAAAPHRALRLTHNAGASGFSRCFTVAGAGPRPHDRVSEGAASAAEPRQDDTVEFGFWGILFLLNPNRMIFRSICDFAPEPPC